MTPTPEGYPHISAGYLVFVTHEQPFALSFVKAADIRAVEDDVGVVATTQTPFIKGCLIAVGDTYFPAKHRALDILKVLEDPRRELSGSIKTGWSLEDNGPL